MKTITGRMMMIKELTEEQMQRLHNKEEELGRVLSPFEINAIFNSYSPFWPRDTTEDHKAREVEIMERQVFNLAPRGEDLNNAGTFLGYQHKWDVAVHDSAHSVYKGTVKKSLKEMVEENADNIQHSVEQGAAQE